MEVVSKRKTVNAPLPQPTPIRISPEAKYQLDNLLRRLNDKNFGKRIRASEVISLALSLLTEEHIGDLKNRSLSNFDKLELLYREKSKDNPDLTKDELVGRLLGNILGEQSKPLKRKVGRLPRVNSSDCSASL